MDEPKLKHQRAIDLLSTELIRLSGAVFARYATQQHDDQRTSIEALEFMGRLMQGKLKVDEQDYLAPYLEPVWEINRAIKVLQAEG